MDENTLGLASNNYIYKNEEMVKHHTDLMTSLELNNDYEILRCITQYQLVLAEKVLDLAQIFPSKKELFLSVSNDWQSRAATEDIIVALERIHEQIKSNTSKYSLTTNEGLKITHIARAENEIKLEANGHLDAPLYSALVITEPHPVMFISIATKDFYWVLRTPMGALAEELLHKGVSEVINNIYEIIK